MNHKTSIRFFNDREVRAVWDDAGNRWLFSVADIVGVLTESVNPRKYWKYLKNKLKTDTPELVSATTQLKLLAPDGIKQKHIENARLAELRDTLLPRLMSGELSVGEVT